VLLLVLGIPLGIGKIVGNQPWALAAYVVLFVNIDFWEYYFLAVNKPVSVFLYTAGRLAARMSVVIITAYFTRNVNTIILSLVILEAMRLVVAAIYWRLLSRGVLEPPVAGLMRDQLRFCLPAGMAAVLFLVNRNLGSIAITHSLGPASLAIFTIGTYGDFVYLALGNSIATVLLPAMVRQNSDSPAGGLNLWKRVTIIRCIFLMPAALFISRYAHQIVVAGFGVHYLPAVMVMQIHMLFLVRGCLDFSPIVRSVNKTQALVFGSLVAMAVNFILLLVLMPRLGIVGAVIALVTSSFAEAITLGWWATRLFQTSIIRLVPWRGIGQVALAATAAGLVTLNGLWVARLGFLGVALAGCAFGCAFIGALLVMRVPEAQDILRKVARVLGASYAPVGH
jgi:O-antigen/teichoic acid export membrane protein